MSQRQPPRSTSALGKGGHVTESAPTLKRAHAGKGAADWLRAAILGGQLRPGTKLSEQSLGETLGVSRNTLREAFAVLGAERIVTRIPNRGVFVAQPSRADVQEMYRIRCILEPAALLQERTPAAGATIEPELAAAVQQGLAARERHDVPGMAAANQQFHALVVALAGSSRLDTLMAHVQSEMRLVFHAMAADPAFHAPFSSQNAEILALWRHGQRAQAAANLSNYLAAAQEQVLAAMPHESGRFS
ncbi:GntR family transcriptional regulator [Arthrobacter sp. PAMC 25486]|uniref:GntR family transcriptional regulator n=1 Tax=Arthrobacter sp. PAMC 25486 TaxID=1494608 RepID=UPI0020A693EE|nr:GntR family transcriptional regulator [Arthrobacter sp. PAMC 25486]